METLLLTVQTTALLLIFILIGYFFKKKNIITNDGRKMLAALLVNLFSPAYSIANLAKPGALSIDLLSQYLIYILASLLLSVILIVIAIPLAKSFFKDKFHRNILKYAFAFGNIGYFGYPLLEGVFPNLLSVYILFCLPMNIAISTYGYAILTDLSDDLPLENGKKAKSKINFKFFYSAPFIGILIGLTLGLLPISVPDFVINLAGTAGKCQSAVAMLIAGSALANVPFKKLFTSLKSYVISFIRLVVIPLIVIGLIMLLNVCGMKGQAFQAVATLCIIASAMPIGMNTVVYPESVGKDGTEGARICFLSYIMALGALPAIFLLMERILPILL